MIKNRFQTLINTGDKNFIEIIRHTFWAVILLGGVTVVQFVFDLLLARNFDAHGVGVFYLCFSVLMILALIGRLGLDRAVVRFIPPLLPTNPGAAAGVKRSAIQLSLIITLPLAILLFVLAPTIAENVFHSSELTLYLRIFAFAIPPLALNYVLSGVLRSMKKTQAALSIERLTMYTLGIVSIVTLSHFFGLEGVTIGFVIAIIISTVMGLFFIKKDMPRYKTIIPFSKKQLLIVSAPLLFVVFGTQMNGQASVLILGAFGTNADVGIFNIALKVSMLMTLILTAINVIAATKISELYAAGKKEELGLMISKISALGVLCGAPLFIIIVLFPQFLLGLFGNSFTAGAGVLIILTAGQLINVSVGSTSYVLAMTGRERALASAVGVSLLVNVLLGFILIPTYGVLGAGITTAITLAVSNIIMLVMIKRYLGIWQLPFKILNVWLKMLTNREQRSK